MKQFISDYLELFGILLAMIVGSYLGYLLFVTTNIVFGEI